MMQRKQHEEIQRYLQQVYQNIETVSASELLQTLMAQQPYLDPQAMMSNGAGVGTQVAWCSVDQAAASSAGAIYSSAGVHPSLLATTFLPQTLGDVGIVSDTVLGQQQMSPSAVIPPVAVNDNLQHESCAGSTARDGWAVPTVPVSDASPTNTDSAAILGSVDAVTETADTADGIRSPGVSRRRTNSFREPAAASSDSEVTHSDQPARVTPHRKQSAEAAGLFAEVPPPASDPQLDKLPAQLPEVSNLGFVPIQNQSISSCSGSMESMASSVAGSSLQQSGECYDLIPPSQQPVSAREMTSIEAASSKSVSCQPTVCGISVQPATAVSSQRPAELLDTLQSLVGQLTAGNSNGASAAAAANEPAQQLQQSQAIIQQQQQQQLASIASAIQNLQHLRRLQEAIGNLATALKTSQLQLLTAAAHAGEPMTVSSSAAVQPTADSVMAATVHPPALPVSSCQPVHVSAAAVPPAAGPSTAPDPRSLSAASQLTAAQLAALGILQYPAAATGSALMMPSTGVQQHQQQLLMTMMQSAPYQQHQQQLLMQQLLSQNAVRAAQLTAAGRIHAHQHQQQLWPVMTMPLPPRGVANTPQSVAQPPLIPAQQVPWRLGVPGTRQPAVTAVTVAAAGATVTTAPPAPVRSGAQTPIPVRPAVTTTPSTTSVPSLQTSLPDQR